MPPVQRVEAGSWVAVLGERGVAGPQAKLLVKTQVLAGDLGVHHGPKRPTHLFSRINLLLT